MKLIVGLGNPEDKYMGTRHNLGFLILDELRRKLNLADWTVDKKFNSEILQFPDHDGSQIIFARPQTHMNRSGMAVTKIAQYFKIEPKDIVVVHDDLDLLLGRIKIRTGGGAGGHHGVESIIDALGTDQFVRFRMGIGNSEGFAGEHKRISFTAEKFVLEPFTSKENSQLKSTSKHAVKALEALIKDGVEKVQNQFN
jgi:PTH1 family peptidyl-tRNA hydrolase